MQRSKYAMLIWNRSGFIDRFTGQENHGEESADSEYDGFQANGEHYHMQHEN